VESGKEAVGLALGFFSCWRNTLFLRKTTMMKSLKSALAIGFLAGASCAVTASSAGAVTINFDGLGNSQSISSGYNGFNWSNFFALNTTLQGVNGYSNGVVSPNNVAFNAFGNPASFSSANTADNFTLNSFYLTAAWNNGLNVLIQGFDDGNVVNSINLVVSTLSPTLFTLNWTGIDRILLTTSGGTNVGYGGSGTHFAMDNLVVNASVSAVPVPAALPLLATGLGALVAAGRRRKRAATSA
jgi:hypothetical protein